MRTMKRWMALVALSLMMAVTAHAQNIASATVARIALLGDQTTNTYVSSGTSKAVLVDIYPKLTIAVTADGGTISAGVLTIEEADFGTSAYTGTWSQISTYDLTALSTLTQQTLIHLPVSKYQNIRVRLSTAVTGGGKVRAVLLGSN